MKKIIAISLLSLCLIPGGELLAQIAEKPVPKWISSKGYWVVEGNKNSPKENTIRFYTNNNQLVYKENISGTKLKLQKNKVKMQLKEVLEKSITEWATSNIAGENKEYVKAILH